MPKVVLAENVGTWLLNCLVLLSASSETNMFSAEWKKVFLGSANSINLREERHRTEEKKHKTHSQRTLRCTPPAASCAQHDSTHTNNLLSGPIRFYVTHGNNWWACSQILGLNRQHELRACTLLLFSSPLSAEIWLSPKHPQIRMKRMWCGIVIIHVIINSWEKEWFPWSQINVNMNLVGGLKPNAS